MQLVHTIDEVRAQVKAWKREGLSVGLVPTMGYLHDGHKSLIERAVKENDRVVVSDFVNPTQFGENEDLGSYPRDIKRDAALCDAAGVELLFNPSPEEMYYKDNCTFVDMNRLTDVLCGKTRPIHFSGVCSVVTKLFHIVTPDRAYFGQKDAQQLAVIRRMVRDLNFDIEIVGCPIVREADGLAMSSRNTYPNEEERKAALVLSPFRRRTDRSRRRKCGSDQRKNDRPYRSGAACKNRLCGDRGCTEFRTGVRNPGRDLSCNGSLYR